MVSCTVFQSKLKNLQNSLTSWKNFASFDTLIVIESAEVVEIEIISKIVSFEMIPRSNTPVCKYIPNILFVIYPQKTRKSYPF